jgi:chemotaxis protein MotB
VGSSTTEHDVAKKHKHEDHTNHEAWAIPYGDLITLLLALFVVMYSMSAINEGKFRVASESLNAAFSGKPRSPTPMQIGPSSPSASPSLKPRVMPGADKPARSQGASNAINKPDIGGQIASGRDAARERVVAARERRELEQMSEEVHAALGDLIDQKLVVVRRNEQWLEIEIQTDILFASGAARLAAAAMPVLDRLAEVLHDFDNHLRIEGHTDDIPIATREFPSNWELSSARAASVVHRFMGRGVDPRRMTVLGLAEYHPVAENTDAAGRNRNRRVVIVVLANPGSERPQFLPVSNPASNPAPAPEPAVPVAPALPVASAILSPEHAQP